MANIFLFGRFDAQVHMCKSRPLEPRPISQALLLRMLPSRPMYLDGRAEYSTQG